MTLIPERPSLLDCYEKNTIKPRFQTRMLELERALSLDEPLATPFLTWCSFFTIHANTNRRLGAAGQVSERYMRSLS